MRSEFYQLRRTTIKDLTAYLGFLVGFLGAAPIAWQFLSDEVDRGGIVRGLWYFFALVSVAGVSFGAVGLVVGFALGWLWERYHRWRRAKHDTTHPVIDLAATKDEVRTLRRIK